MIYYPVHTKHFPTQVFKGLIFIKGNNITVQVNTNQEMFMSVDFNLIKVCTAAATSSNQATLICQMISPWMTTTVFSQLDVRTCTVL